MLITLAHRMRLFPSAIIPFAVVGLLAAAVHYSIAVAGVMLLNISPLASNVCGYLVALLVSYLGQSRFTFAAAARPPQTFLRFTIVSFSGFALNYLSYAALLRWTSIDYRVALLLVLIGVAGCTYFILSKWVFAKRNVSAMIEPTEA